VPLPFTRVAIEVGDPVDVPEQLTEAELEARRRELEDVLTDLGVRARRRAGA
jgi:hypothetical protein